MARHWGHCSPGEISRSLAVAAPRTWFINNGAISRDLFNDSNGEQIGVVAKLEPLLSEVRAAYGPHFAINFEKLIDATSDGRERTAAARQQMVAIRERLAQRQVTAAHQNPEVVHKRHVMASSVHRSGYADPHEDLVGLLLVGDQTIVADGASLVPQAENQQQIQQAPRGGRRRRRHESLKPSILSSTIRQERETHPDYPKQSRKPNLSVFANAFSHFEFQIIRLQARFAKSTANPFDKAFIPEFGRGDIDGYRCELAVRC